LPIFGADHSAKELSEKLSQCTIDINRLTKTDPKTEKKHSNERTPLMYAVLNDDLDGTISLLEQGADPYITNPNGFTALLYAAQKGHYAIAATLLATCLDKQKLLEASTTKKGSTPLSIAKTHDHTNIFKLLTLAQSQTTFGPTCSVHFSPNILPVVLNCINNEKESVTGAMYSFTHGDPARSLVKRHKKDVNVELIVDKDYVYINSTKSFDKTKKSNLCIALRYMIKNGINIYECNLGSNGLSNNGYFNMHNKFLIFGNNTKDRPLLITGSCNFTHQGFEENWENITIIDDTDAITKFLEQYKTMKKSAKKILLKYCKSDKDTLQTYSAKRSRRGNKIEGLA
jgi:hypothetical protein